MTLSQEAQDYLDSLDIDKPPSPVDEDQPRWSWLHAQLGEAEAPRELTGALYFLQDLGATFEPADRGMRMVPGSCPERVYEAIKDEILTPHAGVLTPILQRMRKD